LIQLLERKFAFLCVEDVNTPQFGQAILTLTEHAVCAWMKPSRNTPMPFLERFNPSTVN